MQPQSRILLVDDNSTNLAILEEMLGDEYHWEAATTGEEALEIAPDFQPDLILLDVMLPGINGYETCRRIRAKSALHNVKIIMVSAKALASERLKGYDAGADDYVTKPFDEEELLAKVRVYLKLKSVEEVDQLKSDLLFLLNHESQTPLSGIILPLEMLMLNEDMDVKERKRYVDTAYESAKHLLTLFDLREVVREAVSGIASQASERKVDIDQELGDATITMLDREQMKSVIMAMLKRSRRLAQRSPGS